MNKRLAIMLLALPYLTGCESYFVSQKNITGGVLCDMLGRQVVDNRAHTGATTEGMSLRTFLGTRIGRSVYLIDELKTTQALESSCDGHATTWRNVDTGQYYSVRPTRTYQGQAGRCRDFTTIAESMGREQVIQGTACRQPDGTWTAS